MTSLLVSPRAALRTSFIPFVRWAVVWAAFGALLVVLVYQVPVTQSVAIGRFDSGYVQGFADATNRWGVVTDETGVATPYRWSSASSAILFPQVGLPAKATIRIRGWRPAGETPPRVRVVLNGRDELGTITTDGTWQELSMPIMGGLLKPTDLFIQLDTDAPLVDDTTTRGVQVDYAAIATTGWPVLPYPFQIAGGALATLLTAALVRRPRTAMIVSCGLALGFLLLYRLGVLPFALRPYWMLVCGVLGVGLLARTVTQPNAAVVGTSVVTRAVDVAAVGVLTLWAAVLVRLARTHVVLSLPGVENDFRVFATRSNAWWCPPGAFDGAANCVWRADGFYQLGYPALLWAIRPFTQGNAFLAAQIVAIASGLVLLGATYLLARSMVGAVPALLALLALALNRWTISYSLYIGTDMPFTAACAVALLLILRTRERGSLVLAGMACGAAFGIRHPGIVLLPFGCLWLWLDGRTEADTTRLRSWLQRCGLLVVGFVLVSLPQMIVNVLDTGNPLYSQQAKNVWLAVYGNTDWANWEQATNDVSLLDIILHNPQRFMVNWWDNVGVFWGTGSEDLARHGRSIALRLLAFPANLVAIAGVVIWVMRGNRKQRWLVLLALVYVAALAVGFMQPRFVLPTLVIAALAAADAARRSWFHPLIAQRVLARQIVVGLCSLTLVLMASSVRSSQREVIGEQDAAAVRAVAVLRQILRPDDQITGSLPANDTLLKYSAIAHRVTRTPQTATVAVYIDGEEPADGPRGEVVGRAGTYVIERIVP